MKLQKPVSTQNSKEPFESAETGDQGSQDDLWFLPGPIEEEPPYLPPGPKAEPAETAIIADWVRAQAGSAVRLAEVAARVGALDDRLHRGPDGWRHRLALIEAADLSWVAGDRIGADRLALWISMRLSSVQDDTHALAQIAWAVRRLTGGPGPEPQLADFLDRRDPNTLPDDSERFADRADGWLALMAAASGLHPICRACMGFHLWNLAGLGQHGDLVEAAVTASRVAVGDGRGALFVPLAMGGAIGLHVSGTPADRLTRWLDGIENATRTAMRQLDDIETWSHRAEQVIAPLSGRTPPALHKVLTEWPLVSAPMATTLTGASRAAVQRNLTWMEDHNLIHEVTGQGRFRMWRAAI